MKRLLNLIAAMAIATLTAAQPQFHIRHFDEADGFSQSHTSDLIQDTEGFIWIATMDGLWQFDGSTFRNYKTTPGDGCPLETNRITKIREGEDHNIICESYGKYFRFDRRTHYFSPDGPHEFSKTHGVTIADKEAVATIPDYKGIHYRIMCHDSQDGLWITSNRGLERVVPAKQPIAPEASAPGLAEEFVRAIYKDHEQRLWIADKNGYIRIVDTTGAVRYVAAQGNLTTQRTPFGPMVYCVFEDSRGNFWIGTKIGGLYQLSSSGDGFTITHHTATEKGFALKDNNVYAISEDAYGHILVATYGGGLNIGESTEGGLRFRNFANGLPYPNDALECKDVTLTAKGDIIVSTTHGLVIGHAEQDISQTKFSIHHREPDRAESLCNDIVNNAYIAHDGTIFLATMGGVDEILSDSLNCEQLSFRHYSTREGLPSDICLSVVEDNGGDLWVVCEAALGCLNPVNGVSLNYMRDYFSGRFIFSEVTPVCLPSGQLMFGTTQGTLTFHPDSVGKSAFVPRLAVDCDSTVELWADAPNLDIRLSALDLNQHERIVYAYMMEGAGRESAAWHYTESGELHFASLAPGTYRLHVKATNGDGVWVDNERVVTIVRHADFSETPYVWMLLGLGIVIVALAIYRVERYISHLHQVIGELQMSGTDQFSIVGDQLREMFAVRKMPEQMADEQDELLSAEDKDFAERCNSYIVANMANADLDVLAMAREMGMSRTKLYAMVKKVYGTSPNNLVINIRIREAQRRLSHSSDSVAEVAYATGFADPKYFSRCFKKLVGMSPSEFAHSAGR